jgi:hypothetical protein
MYLDGSMKFDNPINNLIPALNETGFGCDDHDKALMAMGFRFVRNLPLKEVSNCAYVYISHNKGAKL